MIIGIDLGGTKLFGALASPSGTLTHETYVAQDETPLAPEDAGKAGRVFDRLAVSRLAHGRGGPPQDHRRLRRRTVPWAVATLEETIDHLSLAVGNIQKLLDPDVIVIGGGMARVADRLIPGIERRLAGALPTPPRLVPSALGYRAAVLGAVELCG